MVSLAPNDDEREHWVLVSAEGDLARVRMVPCPRQVPDAAINAVIKAVADVIEGGSKHILLDLTGCARADSRVVALACEAVRECAAKDVSLEILPSAALKAWLFVYRIPLLKRVIPGGRWRRPATVLVPPTT